MYSYGFKNDRGDYFIFVFWLSGRKKKYIKTVLVGRRAGLYARRRLLCATQRVHITICRTRVTANTDCRLPRFRYNAGPEGIPRFRYTAAFLTIISFRNVVRDDPFSLTTPRVHRSPRSAVKAGARTRTTHTVRVHYPIRHARPAGRKINTENTLASRINGGKTCFEF